MLSRRLFLAALTAAPLATAIPPQDSAFDVTGYLASKFDERFAPLEKFVLEGTGSGRPVGLLLNI